MAEKEFRKGDHVSWASHSGRAYGVVKEKLVDRTHVRGHAVNASAENPQYRILHNRSGRDVAHRPEVLRHEPE